MNVRNEIKAQIVRAGITMQEVVDLLHDEYGWSDSVSNLSAKLQRESIRYKEAVELADVLGYDLICAEMKDEDIVALIKRLGYIEGLPVVVDPKILDPKAFIDEVIEQRLPNPFMPDAPQRIATDTSQKVGIRFGETIKSYVAEGRDLNTLVSIPLAIAGWLRYLLAVDDNGNAFEVSADPLKDDLQAKLATIKFGAPDSCTDQLDSILSNASIFGSDLTKTVLADKVKAYFKAEIAGPGAVRKTLHDAVNA